jgi:XTP/dITP diphosphohydrolase
MTDHKILIATGNPGKLREYQAMLADLGVACVSKGDAGLDGFDVPETGDTFEANARLKAAAYAQKSGLPTLADDSGLVVDALDGAPGVYSARYAGPGATDADRYQKLLAALEDVPETARTAHFQCVIALAEPDGAIVTTAAGTCEGRIAFAPRGENGFGFDPVFVLAADSGHRGRTMAELPDADKNRISHRARALQVLIPDFKGWLRDVGTGSDDLTSDQ